MISTRKRASEAGFSLIEVVLCVALLVAGAVAALGVLPSLVRASQSGLMRDAAAGVGRNAIERVRAAVAYYPAATGTGGVANAAGHAWAFDPSGSSSYVAAVRVHRSLCGSPSAIATVPMPVTIGYDLPSDTIRVTVSYPRNPCDASALDSVSLSMPLPASQWSPQTQLPGTITDPALQ